jgi:hypothetical protein
MKLSSCRENTVVKILQNTKTVHAKGHVGIIIDRCPEDRSSGVTTVHFEDGDRNVFIWDHDDPEVEVVGTGKLSFKIEMDKP